VHLVGRRNAPHPSGRPRSSRRPGTAPAAPSGTTTAMCCLATPSSPSAWAARRAGTSPSPELGVRDQP
jgi:hypothetical protein